MITIIIIGLATTVGPIVAMAVAVRL